MPIQLVCDCGKQLRVPDEYVGRRVQCPGCGASHFVAEGQANAAADARPAPGAAALPEPGALMRFACGKCGHMMQARVEHAGRAVRCPRCQESQTIPTAEGDRAEKRPRRWTPAAVVLLLLLALATGAAVWWFWPRQPPAPDGEGDDLALVPVDAQGFTSIRLADVWKVPAVREALTDPRRPVREFPDPVDELDAMTGLRPEEVERLTFVAVDLAERIGYAVARTAQPYDRRKVLSRLRDGRDRSAEGRNYYSGTTRNGRTVAVHFAGTRVLVFGPEEGVRFAVARVVDSPVRPGPLRPLIDQARGTRSVVAGLAANPRLAEALRGNLMTRPLADAQLASAFADVGDEVTLEARAKMKDEKAAQQFRKSIGLWANLLGLMAGGGLLRDGRDGGGAEDLAARLQNLKPEQEGDEVRLRTKADVATAVRALTLILPRLQVQ